MKVILTSNVESFLSGLTEKEVAKVIHTLELLETFGHELGMPHSRHMSDGLLELRIPGKRAIRILYCFKKQSAFILHAFVKKKQRTPLKEIETARNIMRSM